MKRDVDDHARSGERTRHARPGEPSCPHDVAADVERGQELVDRLRDPACGYDGAQRRSLDGCQHSVPAEGARPDRHEVKERHPEETHPGRGEGPRDLADTQIEEERGEERGPTGQSDVHQGDEPRRIGASGRRWLSPRSMPDTSGPTASGSTARLNVRRRTTCKLATEATTSRGSRCVTITFASG